MIISPFALWFVIGSVVAIYSLIDDLYISKNREVYLKSFKDLHPDIVMEDSRLIILILCTLVTLDILLGPVAIWCFYKKIKNSKKLKAAFNCK